jgi:hypothetical protein
MALKKEPTGLFGSKKCLRPTPYMLENQHGMGGTSNLLLCHTFVAKTKAGSFLGLWMWGDSPDGVLNHSMRTSRSSSCDHESAAATTAFAKATRSGRGKDKASSCTSLGKGKYIQFRITESGALSQTCAFALL